MELDLSDIETQIVTEREETFDLLGKPMRTWPVIYLTPPWGFSYRGPKGEKRNSKDVPTLGLPELATIPIPRLLSDDGTIFMWVPDGRLPLALELLSIWGVRYNGMAFLWAKTREDTVVESMHHEYDLPMSTGYITRGNPMPMIMGVRGEPSMRKHRIEGQLRPRHDIRKLQFAPRVERFQAHPKFRGLISQLYDGPYLELFGDGERGWDHWTPDWSKPID